jgi:hypothetical protein
VRDYGRVYSSFWTSEDTRKLSDDAKMLALYLLSGPHGTIAGVCRLPDGYVHEDLGWSIKRVREGFGELFRKGFANRCINTEWVWICRFLAWNTPENPNQWKAARKIASSVPAKCTWKADFSRVFANAEKGIIEPLPNPFETLSKPLPTQDQDQDQDQKQNGKKELNPQPPLKKGAAIRHRRSPIRAAKDEARVKWTALLQSGGKERDGPVESAIKAIGGWIRIERRTEAEEPRLVREFCDAYIAAVQSTDSIRAA